MIALALLLASLPSPLPSSDDVGTALAVAESCRDEDGLTLCDPTMQPLSATFRDLLCAEYGADLKKNPIVRCVFKGARMRIAGIQRQQPSFVDRGDGTIDVVLINGSWLPSR